MCGLAGYVAAAPRAVDPDLISGLLEPIRRRGPDDEGIAVVSRAEDAVVHGHTERSAHAIRESTPALEALSGRRHDIVLAHTRYAVIDLSAGGHQPLALEAPSIVVALQGEIFNYVEVRRELVGQGAEFRTASDTEVLARAFAEWGDGAWERLNGLWAAAVYDVRNRRLVLCRDRLGIAPLHIAGSEAGTYFGSSAIGVARACFGRAVPAAVTTRDFLNTGVKDADGTTLIEGVRSIPPGAYVSIENGEHVPSVPVRYWDLPARRLERGDLSLDEAAGRLRDTLASAVDLRLRADLEVGFQLSGGLDSTSIIALASELRPGPLPTYTVSSPEDDEEPLARRMETAFALDRTTLGSGADGLLKEFSGFARLMEEPVQAPGAYGHHRLCAAMRTDGFGVTLSGSGGDEVLAGYEWDFWPAARRSLVERGRPLYAAWHHTLVRLASARRARVTIGEWAARLRLSRGLAPPRPGYRSSDEGRAEPSELATRLAGYADMTFDEQCRFHIRTANLPYYLASNDRATLGIPIEHRQPFLDHRVVELGLSMPVEYLFRNGWTKYVLRRAMAPVLPREIVWRREKSGFPFPVGRFVRDHRSALEPVVARAAETFLERPLAWDDLVETDPLRLWRAASVGTWLDVLADGGGDLRDAP